MSKHTFPHRREDDAMWGQEINIGDIITLLKEGGSELMTCVVVTGGCYRCAFKPSNKEKGCFNYNFACSHGMMLKRVSDTMEDL